MLSSTGSFNLDREGSLTPPSQYYLEPLQPLFPSIASDMAMLSSSQRSSRSSGSHRPTFVPRSSQRSHQAAPSSSPSQRTLSPFERADSRTKVNVESTTQDDDDFGDHYTALLSEAQDAYTDKEPPFLVSHPGAEITRVVRLQNNQTGKIHFEQVRKPESQPDFPYIICLIVADYNSGARRVPRGSGHSRTIKAKDTFSNISGKEAVDTVRGWGLINNSKTRP